MSDQCCHRLKHRDEDEIKSLMNRLSRVEGQVRGIKKMVDEDVYCVDILTQVSAVQAALSAFSRALLESHIKTCVVEDIKSGGAEKVDELIATLQKFIR